ncbi:hypothetical protein BGAL_0189g00160 [Botrytis galanthina]|uniref:DUF6594 domain-containing protein n=1 Tax=Botrytis galanthina TaxID=278940 RepID=A0A4S8QW70_9HELO|nr:hypothetical protein BGAL_0189g00160 [Botrytis galanthina]
MAEGARSMDNEHKGHADLQHYNTTNAARQDRSTVPDAKFHAGSRVYYDHPDIPLGKLKAVVKAGPFFFNEKMETSKANEEHVWHIYKIHYHFDGETTLLENCKVAESDLNRRTENKTAVREFPMTTLPLDTNDEDLMEKGELGVRDVVMATFLDNKTLQPIRLEGVTQEQFKQSLPSQTTERYLQYLRGVKGRKDAKECIVSTIERRPQGYPQLAAVIDSDEQFMLYRRFGHLQARILLNKQDELRELEDRLAHIDRCYARRWPARLRSRDICNAESNDLKGILEAIEEKYKEYVQLLTHAQTLTSFDRPMTVDYLRLKSYFDREAPLCGDEQQYILTKEDLITLKPSRENTWLDSAVEKIPQNFPCRLTRYIFASIELQQKTDPSTTKIVLFNPDRVNAIVSAILLVTVLTLLIVPVYILWYLNHISTSSSFIGVVITVLLVFTFIFSAVLSLFTRAKRHEVLAAAAAYCAVLVVFVGNVGSLSPPAGG